MVSGTLESPTKKQAVGASAWFPVSIICWSIENQVKQSSEIEKKIEKM